MRKVMGMFKKRNSLASGGATDRHVEPPREEYDYAKEGDLAADGDVAGLYTHMKDCPAEGGGRLSYDDVFHIAERVAEAIANEVVQERVDVAVRQLAEEHEFVMDKMIHDEVEYQIEQRVQDFMDEMEAGARLAVNLGLEDNDCVCKGEN